MASVLSHFSKRRFFFPFRPIAVSPLSLTAFLSPRGLEVLISELKWIWLPSAAFGAFGYVLRSSRALLLTESVTGQVAESSVDAGWRAAGAGEHRAELC